MSGDPFFSIVLATYGRGQHIRPTIESVLGQAFTDFELIVVGDGCTDDTEDVVRSFAHEMVAWRNLPHNTGSQSFPNNEGIRCARGRWICYIGHDDIWAPDHLQALKDAIESSPTADFAVSGCIFYGPTGSDIYIVKGLFDAPDAPFHNFFPPTSLAHRRDVPAHIGGWRDPRIIKPSVDADFLLRAAHAGMRFVSTGRITAHKFAAGHRYLSYLRPSSDEQSGMLRALAGARGIDLDTIVRASKYSGNFMTGGYAEHASQTAGLTFEQNRQNKGINRAALQPLHGRIVIEQTDELRALDWYPVEMHGKPFRWSGPNPRPKILIPFTGARARVSIEVVWMGLVGRVDQVSLYVEGRKTKFRIVERPGMLGVVVAEIGLKPDDYTVLMLETPMFCPQDQFVSTDSRKLGAAVADIVIEPL